MNEIEQYREEISALTDRLGEVVSNEKVGIIVPALMEIVMSVVLSIEDKESALASTKTLHDMINYIESQLQAVH